MTSAEYSQHAQERQVKELPLSSASQELDF